MFGLFEGHAREAPQEEGVDAVAAEESAETATAEEDHEHKRNFYQIFDLLPTDFNASEEELERVLVLKDGTTRQGVLRGYDETSHTVMISDTDVSEHPEARLGLQDWVNLDDVEDIQMPDDPEEMRAGIA